MKSLNVFLLVAVMLVVACTSESFASSPLKLVVNSAEMAGSFTVYNGCGTNISPPPVSGGGIPLITMTEGGTTFLAGKIETKEKDVQFIKIKSTIKNPSQTLQSFRVGDIFLLINSKKVGDLAGVGLRSEACAIYEDANRKIIKKQKIDIPPGGQIDITYIFFPIDKSAPKEGSLSLGNSAWVTFEIKKQN